MSSVTIRINESDKETLRELKDRFGEPFPTIIHKAVEEYRRRRILEAANEAYEKIRGDPKKQKKFDAERDMWEITQHDGFE